ncbi:Primosomal replication protein N [Candidatus Hartigia pinicola]|nr:Primosomal replication protein N [Candidatus Hartigia pinicola]
MLTNYLVLAGTVRKGLIRHTSPSGIPHCYFVLTHRSEQFEGGFARYAWCRMPIVASGKILQSYTCYITVGSRITVTGFISTHEGRNGLNKLVLHAEKIDLIDLGE